MQFLRRVVQRTHRFHELRHHLRFLIERTEDSILGPLRIFQSVDDIVADMFFRWIPECSGSQAEIDDQIQEIQDGDGRYHNRQKLQPEKQYPSNPKQPNESESDNLPGREGLQGGKFRWKSSENCDLVLTHFHA